MSICLLYLSNTPFANTTSIFSISPPPPYTTPNPKGEGLVLKPKLKLKGVGFGACVYMILGFAAIDRDIQSCCDLVHLNYCLLFDKIAGLGLGIGIGSKIGSA